MRVVRLLSETNPLSSDVEDWEATMIVCHHHNVRLEDKLGRLIVIGDPVLVQESISV